LYGYIDKNISFNQDLTLLVGINGSGKTSVLNLINWILKPSLPSLCVTEFKSIQLFFHYKGIGYEILCKHNKASFKYSIKSENEEFYPLSVRTKIAPTSIKNDDNLKMQLIQFYSGLRPDQKEQRTWDLISTFPNPTVIGLDRNLCAEEEQYFHDGPIRGKILKKENQSNVSPLDRVKEIVDREYRKKKDSILKLTSNLKNYLMLSTFEGSITIESLLQGVRYKLNLGQIEKAENRINEYLNNFEKSVFSQNEQNIIANYFSQLKQIIDRYQNDPEGENVKLLYSLNANQFIKVNKLLKEFEKFEAESNSALEQINTYIETLNFFFKDSAKRLLFKEDTAELMFNALDKNGNILTEFKDIKFLSSGEQQILMLFSYIAFNSSDGRVFIIDEPELSLHIKWQEEFLSQLEKITPKATQLILATHSPILVNKKKQKTRILFPYNS
jgi:predicted ATPase